MLLRKDSTGAEFTACGSIVCGSVVEAQLNCSADALIAASDNAPPSTNDRPIEWLMSVSLGMLIAVNPAPIWRKVKGHSKVITFTAPDCDQAAPARASAAVPYSGRSASVLPWAAINVSRT